MQAIRRRDVLPSCATNAAEAIGWQSGTVLGVYAHGLFEDAAVMRALFGAQVRTLDACLDGLADFVDAHMERRHARSDAAAMSTTGSGNAAPADRRPAAKGWCPGAYRPMLSGDGLIVRVRPRLGRLALSQALGLCDTARRFGSGIIELTSRANLQLRGVRDSQYPQVLAALAGLGLIDPDPALEERRNIVVTPWWRAGDDSERLAGELAARLGELPPLPAKFGFAVDAGPAPVLAAVSADVRIERAASGGLIVRAEGSAHGISVEPSTAVDVAIALAAWFAATASHTRMKAHLAAHALPAALAGTELPAPQAALPLPGPTMLGPVYGVAFGQTTADALEALLRDRRGRRAARRTEPHDPAGAGALARFGRVPDHAGRPAAANRCLSGRARLRVGDRGDPHAGTHDRACVRPRGRAARAALAARRGLRQGLRPRPDGGPHAGGPRRPLRPGAQRRGLGPAVLHGPPARCPAPSDRSQRCTCMKPMAPRSIAARSP